MKIRNKLLTYIEVLIVASLLFGKILPDWNKATASVGDFFCLEVMAMLMYNIYENVKNKV